MKPIIGITPSYSYEKNNYQLSAAYVKAVQKAGGIPLVLCPNEEFPDYVQGILFSGGGDVDPLLFHEEPLKENGEISPLRDAFELELCREGLKRNIPMLGVCRGMQVFSTVTGGGIFQDIYSQTQSTLKHMQNAPRFYGTHTIDVTRGSLLSALLGENSLPVNSYHHQAVSSAGEGFRVCARSKDGLIEAIEHTQNSFVLGVQWHPEAMKDKEQSSIFRGFVEKASLFDLQRR